MARFFRSLLVLVLFLISGMTVLATDHLLNKDDISQLGLSPKQQKRYSKQLRKDSIRAHQKVWFSILGGPSYTPEASFGVGGALLATFRMNNKDTISQRSFLPVGFNVSLNGTMVLAGAGVMFFNENKFRIFTSYGYRNEPANYYGKGFESVEKIHRSDSTTEYRKQSVSFYPRFVWEVLPKFYIGPALDISYVSSTKMNPIMAADSYVNLFEHSYFNAAIGAVAQYDTRDDVATPMKGMLLSSAFKVYGHYLGGEYNYRFLELESRQFFPLFRERSVLAWAVKTQMTFGDVPFTELPSFGSPNDLRGYYMGKYRDKTMGYSILEYRHMFGTERSLRQGDIWSKFGFVVWGGMGTMGNKVSDWDRVKFNYGAGLRIQLQPRKNFRLDIGKEPGTKGMLVYFNMTEAF